MEDLDGDPDTENEYGPEYYAQIMLKITELAPVPPAEKGEYEYVAIVVTPSEVSLREWKGDEVTLLDSAEVESEKDVWYDLVIEWEEETLTVSRGLRGGEKEEILSAETTLETESTKVGFGLGAKADYLFDDVRFAAPSLSGGQSTMGRQYAYDAFGRRVAESYYVDGVSQTRYYVYDGDRVVEELDGDGNMTAGYVFGPYVDEVLAMRRDVDNNGTLETFYYLHDDQFNVIALTDAAGNVVERYEYGNFGDPTIYDAAGVEREDKTSAFGNVYMFQGRPYDAETGLYYYRTRYLDPVQGRFVSRDTIGVWGDPVGLGNPYTFGGNSPWTNRDPYGEGVIGWMLAGDYNVSDAMIIGEGLKGAGQGAAVVADTTVDTLSLGATGRIFEDNGVYSDNDAGIRGSKILARVGVEAGIMAATMGTGNAAIGGSRTALYAHRGIVAYDTVGGAVSAGQGIAQVANGEYLAGTLNILGGGFRAGGAVADARRVGNAIAARPKADAKGNLHGPDGRFVNKPKAASPAKNRKTLNGNSLDAKGPHDVYVIRDQDSGALLHFGETGRGYLTRAKEHARYFEKRGIQISVDLLSTVEGKAAAKLLERRYIRSYARIFGKRPPYNFADH